MYAAQARLFKISCINYLQTRTYENEKTKKGKK